MGEVPTTVHAESQTRPGETMKALAWFGTGDVRLINAPVPDITEPDDVILKVTGTTICGSDLHLFHGEIMTLQKGDILGHEVRTCATLLTNFAEMRWLVHGRCRQNWSKRNEPINRTTSRCVLPDCLRRMRILPAEAFVFL